MRQDVPPAGADPAGVVIRHLGIGDDPFGRHHDDHTQIPADTLFSREHHANTGARYQIGERLQSLGGDRLVAVGAAVRMARRNRVEEGIRPCRARCERDPCRQRGLRSRRRLQTSLDCLHFRFGAEGPGREHQIFDRASQSEMHLATERIEAAQMAGSIGVDRDGAGGDDERPGLGIVRTGSKDGGAKRPAVCVVFAAGPLVPGLVGGAAGADERPTIPGPVSDRRQGERSDTSRDDGSSACHPTFSAREWPRGAAYS